MRRPLCAGEWVSPPDQFTKVDKDMRDTLAYEEKQSEGGERFSLTYGWGKNLKGSNDDAPDKV